MKTTITYRVTMKLIAALFVVFLFSCQKENSLTGSGASDEEALQYSDESAQADASFDDVADLGITAADEEALTPESGRGENLFFPRFDELRLRLGPCAVITVVPNDSTYPKTITIDFGAGCICADGKFRKGAIILHLTGPIRRTGSVLTVTFRDYYMNRAHIEGTKVITNMNENGNIRFTVQVVGGRVTFPNGRGYGYESFKYVHQVAGGATRTLRDDVYQIEGRSRTEFNSGVTVTLDTERPLVKKFSCHWISNGLLKIRMNNRELFLNYGFPDGGECDNKALLTWNNGNSRRIILLP
ncbi:MAG TPA: hypothetical protein VEB63_09500 [Chitinophagaceae bacterium]|nr:hypothetical protein [Chitinophagaceae bacterium]